MKERDGAKVSLWQDLEAPLMAQQYTNKASVYDVAIVGAGITGITTAVLLQKAGMKCIILEAHEPGFGTTGGTTAHINTVPDTPYNTIIKNFGKNNAILVANALKEAVMLIKENVSQHSIDCEIEEVPSLLFSQTEEQDKELDKIIEACETVGISTSLVDDLPLPVAYKRIMKVASQAKFHPLKYVSSLAKVFTSIGGEIVEGCRVNALEENSIVDIETSAGTFKANRVVFATHIPPGVNLLHLRCVPWRSYAIAFEISEENNFDELVYDMYDPYHYWRTQKIDKKRYMIVGGEDHKTGHADNTNASFLNLEAYVAKYIKPAAIQYQWSSQYFEPADGLPYIGHLPGHNENILVATGYGGNGMVYSAVAAMLLSSMILQKDTPYLSLFDPNRIKPIAGFKSFISHNADVVKQFIGKWFHHEQLESISGLAHDEGRVVNYEGEQIAVYKSEKGVLYALNPVCTHLKCLVTWNAAEKTWDCPCHGARYNIYGEVVTGPASQPLETIEIRQLVEKEEVDK